MGAWHPSFRHRWEDDAACRPYPTWWWFSPDAVESVEAFSICATCAVRSECLAFALERPQLLGLWGGMTEDDRRRIRRTRRRPGAHPASS